jgi:hypothetical protein
VNYFYKLLGLFGLVFLVSIISLWTGRKYPDRIEFFIYGISLSIGYLIWKLLDYDTYLSVWIFLYLIGTMGFVIIREVYSKKENFRKTLTNLKLIFVVTIMPMAFLSNVIVKGDIWNSSIIDNALLEATQYGFLLKASVVLIAFALICFSLLLKYLLKYIHKDEEPTSYSLYWMVNIILVIFFILYMVPCVLLINNYL